MTYEVNSNLDLVSQGWRKIQVKYIGVTKNNSNKYLIVDDKDLNVIIKIFINFNNKTVTAYQGRYRKLQFKFSEAIDGNRPEDLLNKIINFLMW